MHSRSLSQKQRPAKQATSRRRVHTTRPARRVAPIAAPKRRSTSAQSPAVATMDDIFVDTKRRTYRNWKASPAVSPDVVKHVYDQIRWGPTAFNCAPLRLAVLDTAEKKNAVKDVLAPGNVAPFLGAPLTVVCAYDEKFLDTMPAENPAYAGAHGYFGANPQLVSPTAQLNAHLQAGYLITALRAKRLDLGPANGFDHEGMNKLLFASNPKTASWKAFMYINIGHGDAEGLFPRLDRLDFSDVSI